MTSTERELTALKSDWRDSGLTWDDFGACTQKHLDDLNDLWFPYNVVNRIKVQSIWYRHHNRDQGLSLSSLATAVRDVTIAFSDLKKRNSSDFTATNGTTFRGFGFTNHCPFFDPTDVAEDGRQVKIMSHFNKTAEQLDTLLSGPNCVQTMSRVLSDTLLVYNDLSKVSQTKVNSTLCAVGKDRTVQRHHLDRIKTFFAPRMQTITDENASMESLDCPVGFVCQLSSPDAYFRDVDGHVRGIFESTDNSDAPAECIRQGAAEASNVVARHLSLGVDSDDILVPVVGTTGYLMQFGVVFALKPSFPVLVMVSKVLDLTDEEELLEAARLLCCVTVIIEQSLPVSVLDEFQGLGLSRDTYHCKPLNSFFQSTGCMQSSLFHYMKVMSKLHRCTSCRDFVVFPICVREFDDSVKNSELVYSNMVGYKIGLPDTKEQRQSFLGQLKTAVGCFHSAGVVHYDLYLSNVMWREVSDSTDVKIKVIDWDAAHFTHELPLMATRDRLSGRRDRVKNAVAQMDSKSQCNDVTYHDLSLLRLLELYLDDESLRARDKEALDRACLDVQVLFLKSLPAR